MENITIEFDKERLQSVISDLITKAVEARIKDRISDIDKTLNEMLQRPWYGERMKLANSLDHQLENAIENHFRNAVSEFLEKSEFKAKVQEQLEQCLNDDILIKNLAISSIKKTLGL